MSYEYSGYLKSILHKPDPDLKNKMESITFSGADLMRWTMRDIKSAREWQRIPVRRIRTENGIKLEGVFDDVLRIDNLAPDDPRFWVPLGTLGWKNDELPVNTIEYPVVELTYRCTSKNARPAWLWIYPGGKKHDGLFPTHQWRTIVRLVSHFGFPKKIDDIIFRLYSTTRTTESFEIESISFRKMTPAEQEACNKDGINLLENEKPKHYKGLDEFLPLGTFLNVESMKRLSKNLGLSLNEYWRLVVDDIIRHNHNTISLSQIDRLSTEEFSDLIDAAEEMDVKIVGSPDYPLGASVHDQKEMIDSHIKPFADSDTILAWNLTSNPVESNLNDILKARKLIEEVDSKHPVAVVTQHPNSYPLYAPLFPVTGIGHASSHAPWDAGEIVRTHEPLGAGQHLWLTSPAFVYATETPEWSSCSEMRLMLNLCFANGAKGWFTYRYHNEPIWVQGNCQRSLTGPFLTFSDLWEELSVIIERYDAIAPLLLQAKCDGPLKKWFITSCTASANSKVPDDVPHASVIRLSGPEYAIYSLVSNDVRAMTSISINIPDSSHKEHEIYDLSEYITTWEWKQIERKQHLEMFPGQMHMFMVAKPDVCEHWRDVIAARIIKSTKRKMGLDIKLARNNNLDCSKVEKLIDESLKSKPYEALVTMKRGRDMLYDQLADSEAFAETLCAITAASAAVCGCDGVLCRMYGRGKASEAREFGSKVLPLVKELSSLKTELHNGKAAEISHQCENLTRRAVKLLDELRNLS